ncbi:MAG: tRNA 2-thiouridine(34) synthase MnmA [Bacteroidales bacterium]
MKKVLLGMSGGTDSSVSAILLQEQGYEVIGITFRFYDRDENTQHLKDAQDLAARLGIEHRVFDARETFRTKILDYFISEYMNGRTPVPCVICNNELKWKLLYDIAQAEEIDYISTGHYIRTTEVDGKHYIIQGEDPEKDQSFFMWGLPDEIIAKMLLPLGELSKSEVRSFAAERGFERAATKKDSLGVCFCPGDYRPFLKQFVDPSLIRPGRFVDVNGKFLAKHEGHPFYTVGQRRGLGINFQHAVFVKEIDAATNTIVLAELKDMYHSRMFLKDTCFINPDDILNLPLTCKIRYRKQENSCTIRLNEDRTAEVTFDEPLHAIAPGQSAVFYHKNRVIGGGIIVSAAD